MISHTMLGTNDLSAAVAFYDKVLGTLGYKRVRTYENAAAAYGDDPESRPPFWVCRAFDGKAATVGNGTHVAFVAPSRTAVDGFHAQALALGGVDEGAPGLRPHYHASYYAAYVRDRDGNKIQAVCHDPE